MGTVHGDRNGNWGFPEGRITFNEINELVCTYGGPCYYLVLYCDCCYSGRWAEQAAGMHALSVQTASGPSSVAINREFAEAKWKGDTRVQESLRHKGALSVKWASDSHIIDWSE